MKRIQLLPFILIIVKSTIVYGQLYAPEIKVLETPNSNVGINIETPYYLLDTRFDDSALSFTNGKAGEWGGNGFRLENTNTLNGAMSPIHLRIGDADIHLAGIRNGSNLADFGLFFEGIKKYNFSVNGMSYGISSPYYCLDFRFDNSTTSFSTGSVGNWGGNGFRLENTNTIIGAMSPIHLRIGDADIHLAGIRKGSNLADLGLYFEGVEKITFKNNGIIHANSFTAENPPWADFVFSEDYDLMELEKVEEFIINNKHLPEIPSEKEVKHKGVDLVEMNAKLLQKVEELTLYLIQQNKKIEDLQGQINELK